MNILKSSWLSIVLLILIVGWLGIYGIIKGPAANLEADTTNPNVLGESSKISLGDTKALAQCLNNKGFKLYGASWCGHCQEQKEMFGGAVNLLNYIECSTSNGNDQAEVCNKAGIEVYPTWEFPDGTKVPGVMTLKELAKTSGCPTI